MAVETFLTPVIERLVDLLVEEAHLLNGVHKEVKNLKGELEILQPFLVDAENKGERGNSSDAMRVWIKQLREEANRIEDVVDEYLYHVGRPYRRSGLDECLGGTGRFVKSLRPRREIASEVQDIKASLHEIKQRGLSYGLTPSLQVPTSSEAVDPRLGSLFVEEDELVGIEFALKDLVMKLVEGTQERVVISLVGEGGIGKTTLARRVFNDEAVKRHFDSHAWVTVPQTYNIERLLRTLKSQICPTMPISENDTIEALIELLKQYLESKRYVLVFDDVWQAEFWEVMKLTLPTKNKGNRIVVTTRNISIAHFIRENWHDLVQELKCWPQEQARELFYKKAFRFEFNGRCPQELELLSCEIVNKCQGLPLVIAAVAGLLSTKAKVKSEWVRVFNNLDYEFKTNPQLLRVSKILSLGYQDLPHHLKSCLLYFGLLPEDYSIGEHRLVRLWIAEGFVELKKNMTLEQVAKEYLNELINRSLVSYELLYGNFKMAHVHDLMRDMILEKVDESCFCQTLSGENSRYREKTRRLSIYGSTKGVMKVVGGGNIRSVLLTKIDEMNESFLGDLFDDFKLLRVLDFDCALTVHLPKQLGNLLHLKYLNLAGSKVKKIPKSIGKLQNLQTLDISETMVRELPFKIKKLRNLRHLECWQTDTRVEYNVDAFLGVKFQEGIGNLNMLQTLRAVEVYPNGIGFVTELEKLRNLHSLGVLKMTRENSKAFAASIEKIKTLEFMFLGSVNKETLDLSLVSSPPPLLRFLYLNGRLEALPEWVSRLQNLQGLELRFSKVIGDPLQHLKGLTNLAYIYFYQTYEGEELHFKKGDFLKVKELKLRQLEGLKTIKIDEGALPLLELFELGPFPLMKEMPPDVQYLKGLKSLQVTNMSREFVLNLQPNEGLDYWKIKHVPSIIVWYKRPRSIHNKYNLGSSELLELLKEKAD